MSPTATATTDVVLEPFQWRDRAAAHEARVDAALTGLAERRSRGQRHPVQDFLFSYYSLRPSRLRRWQPGAFVALRTDDGHESSLDVSAYLDRRGEAVAFVHALLSATAARPAQLGCFGLHEWAMVYRQGEHRHPDPLRLSQSQTDAVVESHRVRCSHYDAFRFFTPQALPLNELQPSAATRLAMEQPGCLHAGMDLYKWAYKLGAAVPSELLMDCFELAHDIRELDMRASPYDLSAWGYSPVAIETSEGKAEYVAAQRIFTDRAAPLRLSLTALCARLLSCRQ